MELCDFFDLCFDLAGVDDMWSSLWGVTPNLGMRTNSLNNKHGGEYLGNTIHSQTPGIII